MNVLVVGATGATGRLLVNELLNRNAYVKIIVRNKNRLPEGFSDSKNLEIIEQTLLSMSDTEMNAVVQNCDAVASCLGHNLTLKGIYGKPRKLVTEAAQRLCGAIKKQKKNSATKYVLMNTSGNRNKDLNEPRSFSERIIISLLRVLVPPHPDNEGAAEFLRTEIGQNDAAVEWAAVRPETLIDEDKTSAYDVFPSPVQSPLFSDGKTSRINVAHFMADLITNDDTWLKWKGQMPVIYNQSNQKN